MKGKAALVIGANGFIGSHIINALKDSGWQVYSTTTSELDLRAPSLEWLRALPSINYVFCCAHFGSIDECKRNRAGTAAVNVTGMIKVLEELSGQNIIPVYLSSNMVFSGERPDYIETEIPAPTTEYGRQKLQVEQYIQKTFSRFVIARLTKVYGLERGDGTLITAWLDAWQQGQAVQAVNDMVIAPIYVGEVVEQLVALAERNRSGIYHIGGQEVATVYDFSVRAARFFHIPETNVQPVPRAMFSTVEKRPPFQTLRSIHTFTDQVNRLSFNQALGRLGSLHSFT